MYPRPWSLIYSIDRAMMGISRQGVVLDSHPGGSGAETKCAVVAIILRNYRDMKLYRCEIQGSLGAKTVLYDVY